MAKKSISCLRGHAYANAKVLDYFDSCRGMLAVRELVSYHTMVIAVDMRTGNLVCTGLYSNTTRRHISWFLREYYPRISYDMVKKIAGTEESINIYDFYD